VLSTEKSYIESLKVLVATFVMPSERYLNNLITKSQQYKGMWVHPYLSKGAFLAMSEANREKG